MSFLKTVFLKGGIAVLIFVCITGGVRLLYRRRAQTMRALARTWGFQFSEGNPSIWGQRDTGCAMPAEFRMMGYPATMIKSIWNLIDGQKDGIRVLIFDSILGVAGKRYRGMYCTVIATQTSENLFGNTGSRERISQSNGWTALSYTRFIQVPWSLSVRRIEEHLSSVHSPPSSRRPPA